MSQLHKKKSEDSSFTEHVCGPGFRDVDLLFGIQDLGLEATLFKDCLVVEQGLVAVVHDDDQ